LPLPPEPPPGRLSQIADLTPAANAAIGTFSATMPLFYADMDTLIQRLGELRLIEQEAPAPTTTIPSGISKEGGKEVVTPAPPPPPPAGGGVWVRGFGSGYHIDDQVSRSFDQNLGGFQIGADKRLITGYGDLYLGRFYAHRDFQNQHNDSTGTTQAFSLGAYGTLIHPSGFYADLVVKYTQLWNDFDAPNVLSSLGQAQQPIIPSPLSALRWKSANAGISGTSLLSHKARLKAPGPMEPITRYPRA
jgi:outer membrane autotransporter protein